MQNVEVGLQWGRFGDKLMDVHHHHNKYRNIQTYFVRHDINNAGDVYDGDYN